VTYVVNVVRNQNLVEAQQVVDSDQHLNTNFNVYSALSYSDIPMCPLNIFTEFIPLEQIFHESTLSGYCNALIKAIQDGVKDLTTLKLDLKVTCSPCHNLYKESDTLRVPLAKHVTIPLNSLTNFGAAMSSTILQAITSWNIVEDLGVDSASLHIDMHIFQSETYSSHQYLLLHLMDMGLSLKSIYKKISTSTGDFSMVETSE